ncbi:MAG: twin-arginine translocase subunit TatC [Verrucomicrobiota bacterium]
MANPSDESRSPNQTEGGNVKTPETQGASSGQNSQATSAPAQETRETTPAPTPAPGAVPRSDSPKSDSDSSDAPSASDKKDEPITHDEGWDWHASNDQTQPQTDPNDPYHNDPYHDSHHGDPHYDEYHSMHAGHDDPHRAEEYHHDEYHHDEPSAAGGSGGYYGGTVGGKPADASPSEEDEDEGGGPVKGFLEHLEDLRWVLIKCVVSVLVAMVVCLVAGNKIVDFLAKPLLDAARLSFTATPKLFLRFGTNEYWINWTTNDTFGPIPLGTNSVKALDLVAVQVGTNHVLALQPNPNPPKAEDKHIGLTVLGPIEAFGVILDIALWGGLGFASPFVFYFIGQFVMPALRKKEKKWLLQGVTIGGGLFLIGVAFCYLIMMQVTLFASKEFAEWMGFTVENWRAGEYISFTVKFMIGMGLSFELPVILLTLVKVGMLDYKKLSNFRSYMIVILLVIAGFVTPSGDPFTMVLMAAPLWVLFEISVFVAWIWYRREQRELAAQEAAENAKK